MRVSAYDTMKETTVPSETATTAITIVFQYICASGSVAIAAR